MNKEVAEAWVKDLRETTAKQTSGMLFDGVGYCCLGRLCVVLGVGFTRAPDDSEWYWLIDDGSGKGDVLSQSVTDEAGMKSKTGIFCEPDKPEYQPFDLAQLNDQGKTFKEIADIIEKYWEQI